MDSGVQKSQDGHHGPAIQHGKRKKNVEAHAKFLQFSDENTYKRRSIVLEYQFDYLFLVLFD
jgi:hypothetical protein